MFRVRVRVRVRVRLGLRLPYFQHLTELLITRTWNGSPRVTKQNAFPLGLLGLGLGLRIGLGLGLGWTWNGSPRVAKQNGFPLGSGQFMMTF